MKKIILSVQSDELNANPRSYPLTDGSYLVGSTGADIVLAYPTVSRRHGRIRIGEGTPSYTDTSSRNGSYFMDKDWDQNTTERPLEAEREQDWLQGVRLRVGPFTLSWSENHNAAETTEHGLAVLATDYARLLRENPANAGETFLQSIESHAKSAEILESIHREFHGDGPLHDLLRDACCREILLNSHDEMYADLGKGLVRQTQGFLSAETFEAWAVRTAHGAGRRLDLQHPICEATLSNGARFHAVMAPVSARGVSVAIRRFGSAPIEEDQALESGWLDQASLEILKDAVSRRLNAVISGGTSTGKTSLLNFLCRYLHSAERVVTVEDTVELAPPVGNLVQLQARLPNADGVGEISLRQLVQCALRMRPDRIIVGECRGSEVLEMLQALNTGHPGSLTTVHANSTDEAIQRLELLALLGAPNLSAECIREWIRTSVDMVIQVERDASGHRHVSAIAQKRNTTLDLIYQRRPDREVVCADRP